MRIFLGFVIALAIGVACRLFRIPSPAPQAILGSLLVVGMSVGYVLTDRCLTRFSTANRQAGNSQHVIATPPAKSLK
jgi:XapX domain-containing protein